MGKETYHVENIVETGNPLRVLCGDTSDFKDGRSINGHTGDTNPFLHNLQPNNELDTTSGVKFARADTEQHGEVRLSLGSLALKLGNVADILELGFGFALVCTSLTTKASEDVAGFFLSADLCEPSRGLWEEPDDGKKEEKRENLEGNRESPNEFSIPISVERTSTKRRSDNLPHQNKSNQLTIRANMPQRHQRY